MSGAGVAIFYRLFLLSMIPGVPIGVYIWEAWGANEEEKEYPVISRIFGAVRLSVLLVSIPVIAFLLGITALTFGLFSSKSYLLIFPIAGLLFWIAVGYLAGRMGLDLSELYSMLGVDEYLDERRAAAGGAGSSPADPVANPEGTPNVEAPTDIDLDREIGALPGSTDLTADAVAGSLVVDTAVIPTNLELSLGG